jgi:hypothetical protein
VPTYLHLTAPITATKVDTSKFAYSVGVCPSGDSTFTGVMINYTS